MLGVIWKLFLLFEFSIFVFFKTEKGNQTCFLCLFYLFYFLGKKKQVLQNGNQIGH